jgi:tripartite-type tricarboxylate transporter receptor subunit TctC
MALIKKDPPAKEEVKKEDVVSENATQEQVENSKTTITMTPEELKALIQEEVRKAQPIVEEPKTAV